jgi:hypothetical protein
MQEMDVYICRGGGARDGNIQERGWGRVGA